MSLKTSLEPLTEPTWHPLALPEGSFEIQLRRPTMADLIRDEAQLMAEVTGRKHDGTADLERLRQLVVGWRDVQDLEGVEIPFSVANLERFIERNPECLLDLLTLVRRAYLGRLDSKNFSGPSVAG